MNDDRSLTDDDVEAIVTELKPRLIKAIVTELKSQLVSDFQMEVGKGVLGWVKRAAILMLILAALYGFSRTGWMPKVGARESSKVPEMIGRAAMRVIGVVPRGFRVMPPRDNPELTAMAEEIDRRNAA